MMEGQHALCDPAYQWSPSRHGSCRMLLHHVELQLLQATRKLGVQLHGKFV